MPKRPRQGCKTCEHPERERIEQEIALAGTGADVGDKWGIHPRALNRHRNNHMTQEQIARLRGIVPSKAEVDIAELTRKGGETAMVGLARLNAELIEIAAKLDALGNYDTAARYRELQVKVYDKQAKVAALYPGLKQVTTNNVVFADFEAFARLAEQVLKPWPDAQRALAAGMLQLTAPCDVIDGQFEEAA